MYNPGLLSHFILDPGMNYKKQRGENFKLSPSFIFSSMVMKTLQHYYHRLQRYIHVHAFILHVDIKASICLTD